MHSITFERHDHPAVFTVEEVSKVVSVDKGIRTKNLFVRDKKGRRHVLIVVPHDKKVDLMNLGLQTGHGRVSFASPQRLMTHLGVEPGSVTLMGVINDEDHAVEVVIVLSNDGMKKLFEATGHSVLVLEVPSS